VLRTGFATPRALTRSEIHGLINRFAAAARVAVECGFSGVQIHAAHGYLASQFLSPLVNRRTDEWGGDPSRRMRFLLAVVESVRHTVGSTVPIGVKLNSADFQRGGFDEAESMAVVTELEQAGVDLLEISGGTYEGLAMVGYDNREARESTRRREAYFLDYAEQVRARTRIPLMLTGGLRTAAGMAHAVSSGAVDLIGLARPLALEPDLPHRLLDGAATASAIPPTFSGATRTGAAGESLWYTGQIWRLADGKDSDPELSMTGGLVRYSGATVRDLTLRALRRWCRRG
jgi:2,4-dienoyl-CoA reductase-like NADH-dependent reductase (Old Yellow Enzyme family)